MQINGSNSHKTYCYLQLKIWNSFKMCQSKTNLVINITVEILYLEAE